MLTEAPARSFRHLIFGGEALLSQLPSRLRKLALRRIINLYGPTETTIVVTMGMRSSIVSSLGVPIGRPIWNSRVYVLDGGLEPVPAGVAASFM